ncbi:unnamed protein product [Blepharisma stoltei]|uniref:Uncharacterized protein n=1 Tax=Blepharisma stoltei TaxID=1481888 RepID=A0AAU9IHA5_9CILI|nr:unnamed protein product [Blepharisma stoltei]
MSSPLIFLKSVAPPGWLYWKVDISRTFSSKNTYSLPFSLISSITFKWLISSSFFLMKKFIKGKNGLRRCLDSSNTSKKTMKNIKTRSIWWE